MIKEIIEPLFTGIKTGIYYWYSVVFNYKMPIGICWLIGILTIPINIVVTLVWLMFGKQSITDMYAEMINDIDEKEEEA